MNIKVLSLFILRLFFLICLGNKSFSQTNPAAQSLPYSQDFTSLLATSTSYPAGWQGWNLATTGTSTAFRLTAPLSDVSLAASSTAATTVAGIHNYNGKVGLLANNTTGDPALCISIVTTGRFTVLVNFDIMTIRNPFLTGSNTRINQVDIQYRVGTTGNFISFSGSANGIYQNNTVNQTSAVTTPQNSLAKSFTLPAACNNQPVVQIRWVQRDFSGTLGTDRPSFAVDNISICPSFLTPTIVISGPTGACSGSGTIFSASITNGGSAPVYQWKKNGVNGGTNTPTITLNNLVPGDVISCVLTSNLTCVTSLTATSNSITMVAVNSPPVISGATISHVSCPGIRNGSIDINISGGTPPYSVFWDTVNIQNGPVYGVTVATKTAASPLFGQGFSIGYVIDGIEGKELFLTKGITYSFSVLTAGHPFHISTDNVGGNSTFIVSSGQTGAPTQSGTVTFTPNNTHPSLLYYPCQFHQFMGWKINLQNGLNIEDPSNLKPGIYSVIVKDANGCTATGQYTVNQLPSTLSLSTVVNNLTCGLPNNGSIDLTVSGGSPPYAINWDIDNKINGTNFGVMVAAKTSNHPYFGLGSLSAFYIDGEEAKELNLVRGLQYTFNVMSPGHPFHISTDNVGGNSTNIVTSGQTGAPNANGLVTFTPNNSHPSLLKYICAVHQYMGYNINISDGLNDEDPQGLSEGIYSVAVTDANGCLATTSSTVNAGGVAVELAVNSTSDATCFGSADGSIDLAPSSGTPPYVISGTGPVFSVIAGSKNHSHPQFGAGSANGYIIDGVHGKELTLIRGITYTFSVLAPGHPFFISTSIVGGPANLASEVTQGVVNSMVTAGDLFFTPDVSHPNLLYFQCGAHNRMGWKINIVDQLPGDDLANCMSGNYSLTAIDNIGCSSQQVNIFISEPPANIFYYDGDIDTYGLSSESALGCSAPSGFVLNDLDCNDANGSIHPGALEICNGIDDNCNTLVDDGPSCTVSFNVKLFIEGFYIGGSQMNASIDPVGSPGVCDTVIIQLARDATPYDILFADTGLVLTNGIGVFEFPAGVSTNSYYIVVRHRTGLETWSANPVSFSSTTTYDFTIGQSQAFGNNLVETFDNMGWAIISGDISDAGSSLVGIQDGLIESQDYGDLENALSIYLTGYVPQDITGDGLVESADYSLMENNVSGYVGIMRP
jgi:hypothetical protein